MPFSHCPLSQIEPGPATAERIVAFERHGKPFQPGFTPGLRADGGRQIWACWIAPIAQQQKKRTAMPEESDQAMAK